MILRVLFFYVFFCCSFSNLRAQLVTLEKREWAKTIYKEVITNGDSAKFAYEKLIKKRNQISDYYRQLESSFKKNTFETSIEFEIRKDEALKNKKYELNEKLSSINEQLSFFNNSAYLLRSNRFRISLSEKDYNADLSIWKMKITDVFLNATSYAQISINPSYAKALWKLKDKITLNQVSEFNNPQKILVYIDFPQSLFFDRLFFQLNILKYTVNKSVRFNKYTNRFNKIDTAPKAVIGKYKGGNGKGGNSKDSFIKQNRKPLSYSSSNSSSNPVKVVTPKAVIGKYKGGNGKGGNNQDSFNRDSNQLSDSSSNSEDISDLPDGLIYIDEKNLNNQDSDNGINNQGIAGGKGDQGVANGKARGKSYSEVGAFVTKGHRKIVKVYSFNWDVEAATIYAEIEVSPSGAGKFIQIAKGSSSNDAKYKSAIREYLNKIRFNVADHISVVTVKFKFEVQ